MVKVVNEGVEQEAGMDERRDVDRSRQDSKEIKIVSLRRVVRW